MMLYQATVLIALFAQSAFSRPARPNRLEQLQKRTTYTPSTIADLIPLGSASNYSVFTLTGIATVQGTLAAGQVVNGDIGVAPIALTAITGFGAVQEGKSNTPFVTGNIHGPPYSTNTPSDIVNAYNIAAGKTPSGPIVTGAGTLDSGVVMTPGVYRWTGALALGVGKTLTLNGHCGDIFIFQTAGAITTGANSQVVLTGGLTAATVYWVSATSLTTGVSSSFAGIVLAKTNVVIAGSLVGAVYAQTEIALHAATISAPLATLATTQIGSICNVATCAVNYGFIAGACVQCQVGYASAGGTTSCLPCSGLNYVNSSGACVPCSAGSLSCDVHTGNAVSCSPGYAGSSISPCQGCSKGFSSPGGLVNAANNACTACSAGFFAAANLASVCVACTGTVGKDYTSCAPDSGNHVTCPSGLALGYTTQSGSNTTCSSCLAGYFLVSPAKVCSKCLSGTSTCSATTGYGTACLAGYGSTSTSACTACLGGSYSSAVGTLCSQVPAGSFALGPAAASYSSCAPTGISAAGASSCSLCAPGSSSTDGGISCSVCTDGAHFLNVTNNDICTKCSTGTISCDSNGFGTSCSSGYGSKSGTTACTACLGGTFSSSPGTVCSQVPVGSYAVGPGATYYTSCSPTQISTIGSSSCTSCAAGSSSIDGGISCTVCNDDTHYLNAQSICTTCAVGTVKCDSSGNTISCLPGYSATSTSSCSGCNAGFASPGGLVSSTNNACTSCLDGFYAASPLASACIPCTGKSGTDYTTCAPDTGNDVTCPAGLALGPTTQSGSTTKCNPCLAGYFSLASATTCLLSDPNAATVDSAGTSLTCNPGYAVSNGVCAGCGVKTFNSGVASSCSPCSDKLSITCDPKTGLSVKCAREANVIGGVCVCRDPFALGHDGASCVILYYSISIRDALDQQSLGVLSTGENSFGVFTVTRSSSVTILFPDLNSTAPSELFCLVSFQSGSNLAIALGKNGSTFDSTTTAYVWITQSHFSRNKEFFSSYADYSQGLAEPNVWVVGPQDSQGRYPISLQFIGSNNSIVTCARFYTDTSYPELPVGATCAPATSTTPTVLLFLTLNY